MVVLTPAEISGMRGLSMAEGVYPKIPKLTTEQLKRLLTHNLVVEVENYPQREPGDILQVPQAVIEEFAQSFRPEDFERGGYSEDYNRARNLLGRLIIGSDGERQLGKPKRYYVSRAAIMKEIENPNQPSKPNTDITHAEDALKRGLEQLNKAQKERRT